MPLRFPQRNTRPCFGSGNRYWTRNSQTQLAEKKRIDWNTFAGLLTGLKMPNTAPHLMRWTLQLHNMSNSNPACEISKRNSRNE